MSDSSADKIGVGDRVHIYLLLPGSPVEHRRGFVSGVVLYYPQDTGDCWHIRTDMGELLYVQQFSHIVREVK